MGLRAQAEDDLGLILNDKLYGFGWDIKLTTPDDTVANLVGFSNDISQIIDPDTGLIISARSASVAIYLAAIYAALPSDGLPENVPEKDRRPWLVEFDDINGKAHLFKVIKSNPDRALGMITCLLEGYKRD